MPTSGLGAQSGMSQLSLSRPNLIQPRPPKFDNIEAHFGMWRSKFKACLSSLVCLYVLKATDNPVMVGDMNVSQEELEQKHSPQVIRDARLVYGLLMESMTGYMRLQSFACSRPSHPVVLGRSWRTTTCLKP